MLEYTTFVHQGQRETQEDRWKVLSNFANNKLWSLFMICDGHGGYMAAEFLLERFPENFLQELKKSQNDKKKITSALLNAFSVAVQEWDEKCFGSGVKIQNDVEKNLFFQKRDKVKWEKNQLESGTTFCACLIDIQERKMYILHIGDSRIVWLCSNKMIGSTVDHCIPRNFQCDNPNFSWTIDEEGYLQGEIAMCRAFGDNTKALFGVLSHKPDVLTVKIGSHAARIILATDGLWDWVSNHEALYEEFKNAQELSCSQITKFEDNATVIYVKINSAEENQEEEDQEEGKTNTKTPKNPQTVPTTTNKSTLKKKTLAKKTAFKKKEEETTKEKETSSSQTKKDFDKMLDNFGSGNNKKNATHSTQQQTNNKHKVTKKKK